MTGEIKSDNPAIQSGSDNSDNQLRSQPGGRGPGGNIDPRLAQAWGDTDDAVRRRREKIGGGIDGAKEDAAGKSAIDSKGASNVTNSGGPGGVLGSLGKGLQGVLGGLGQGSGGGMPQMPQMPSMGVPSGGAGGGSPWSAHNGNGSNGFGSLTGAKDGRHGQIGVGGPRGQGDTDYQQRIIELAKSVVAAGIPYSWGSGDLNGPTCSGTRDGGAADAAGDYCKTGFDCSGLSRFLVYQASGVEIPRTSQDQYTGGMEIGQQDAQPGDLVFPEHSFGGGGPGHVQVYVGDGKVVEAQQSGTDVQFSDVGPSRFVRYVAQ